MIQLCTDTSPGLPRAGHKSPARLTCPGRAHASWWRPSCKCRTTRGPPVPRAWQSGQPLLWMQHLLPGEPQLEHHWRPGGSLGMCIARVRQPCPLKKFWVLGFSVCLVLVTWVLFKNINISLKYKVHTETCALGCILGEFLKSEQTHGTSSQIKDQSTASTPRPSCRARRPGSSTADEWCVCRSPAPADAQSRAPSRVYRVSPLWPCCALFRCLRSALVALPAWSSVNTCTRL